MEAKTSPLMKCSLSPAGMPSVAMTTVACLQDSALTTHADAGPPLSFHIVRLSVLRI
jgi:hypothetical protein